MICSNPSSGDVVLFSGTSHIHRLVQRVTCSPLSQVRLIVHLPTHREALLLEATSTPTSPDIETGGFSPVVRTTIFAAKLQSFEGTVAIRALQPSLTEAFARKLAVFRRSVIGRPFDFSLLANRRSIRRRHEVWNADSFICSSLVAHALQLLDVWHPPPQGPFPNNVLPKDFSNDDLPFIVGQQ